MANASCYLMTSNINFICINGGGGARADPGGGFVYYVSQGSLPKSTCARRVEVVHNALYFLVIFLIDQVEQ